MNQTKIITWDIPSALNYLTWNNTFNDLKAYLKDLQDLKDINPVNDFKSVHLNWQYCQTIDSSAIGFIFNLKRHYQDTQFKITHLSLPVQLIQLAQLYEVDDLI